MIRRRCARRSCAVGRVRDRFEVAPRDDERLLDKISFSAFEGTRLAMI